MITTLPRPVRAATWLLATLLLSSVTVLAEDTDTQTQTQSPVQMGNGPASGGNTVVYDPQDPNSMSRRPTAPSNSDVSDSPYSGNSNSFYFPVPAPQKR